MAKAHRCQLEKLTSQCEKLTEELAQNENENRKLKQKYQCLKEELEEKVNVGRNPHLKDSSLKMDFIDAT